MTSATPTRRVLGALDVNTPTPRSVAPSPRAKAGSPEKPQKMGEVISLQAFEHSLRDAVYKEGRVDVGKRSFSPLTSMSMSSSKRRKTGTSNEKGYGVAFNTQRNTSTFGLAQAFPESEYVEVQSFTCEDVREAHYTPGISSLSVSPSSSVSHNAEMNDSQNTILTEPDDVPPPAAIRVQALSRTIGTEMTKEEIRESASEMKLRLRLAGYKVRTNQIHLPLSRLEIRSCTSSTLPKLSSLLLVSANTSQHRTPLPSIAAAPSIPNIQLQKPSAEKKLAHITDIPSSPPSPYCDTTVEANEIISPSKEINDTTREGFATPLLPRQCQAMLNPPTLGSPIWEDRRSELTSSVVKDRAADGLLCLMRHQN